MKMFLNWSSARGAVPFAIFFAAVVLKGDAPARRQIRDLRASNHRLAIKRDVDGVATHGDFKMIPFADGFVRLRAWRGGRTHLRRQLAVHANPVHFTGADGPAEDVHLIFARTAQQDARVGIREREFQFFAVDIACVRAIGQDVRNVWIHVRRLFDTPIHVQHEVAELALGPETFVAVGFAFSNS